MKIAEIGNVIEFGDGLQGIVEKVNENSVIVNLTYMENFNQLDMEERTVVNHKRYKILANVAEK
ncbi:YkvS family protein [Rummeliibacillus sp. JY-2-4R]